MNFGPLSRLVAGTATDKSQTSSGVAQLIVAANANRLAYELYNPLTGTLNSAGDKLYVGFDSTVNNTGNSFEMAAGSYFPPPGFPPWNGDIWILAASGVKFTAKEFT